MAVALVAAAPCAARRSPPPSPRPADVCAFRLGTVQALFTAASGTSLAIERMRAGDVPAAVVHVREAARALGTEVGRVKKQGRSHLEKQVRRQLRAGVAGARRAVTRAARIARHEPAD